MKLDPVAHGLYVSESRPPIPGGGPQSVVAVLDVGTSEFPDREALVGRRGRFCYAELNREAHRAAHVLRSPGGRGRRPRHS